MSNNHHAETETKFPERESLVTNIYLGEFHAVCYVVFIHVLMGMAKRLKQLFKHYLSFST